MSVYLMYLTPCKFVSILKKKEHHSKQKCTSYNVSRRGKGKILFGLQFKKVLEHMPNKGAAKERGLSTLLALVDVGCHFLYFGLGCYHTALVFVLIPPVWATSMLFFSVELYNSCVSVGFQKPYASLIQDWVIKK